MKKYPILYIIILFFPLLAFADDQMLNVFTWSEYVPSNVVTQFSQETGIKVIISTFESNEAMYAKLKLLGGKGYDIVMPSSYFIKRLIKINLLDRLDKSKIIGLHNLTPDSLGHSFDPYNEYSIPYMWGSLGILVNKKVVNPNVIKSFNDLNRPEFKGKILLSDDMRDTFGVALKAKKYSVNTTNVDEIKAGYEWLKEIKPGVRVFDVTLTKQAFIEEEVLAGIIWNGDAFIAMTENPHLEFIIPKEGLITWVDNLSILRSSKNKENAYAFINFLLRPEIAKQCVEEFFYTTPNMAGEKLLDASIRMNHVIFPGNIEMANGEMISDVGSMNTVYTTYWEKLKLSQ